MEGRIMRKIFILFAIAFIVVNYRTASATEIYLERTRIPEGNFSILLYKPVRTELPLRDESADFIITTYSYQSYFKEFDVSYTAGFTDWTPSKEYEINKYGSVLSDNEKDLETSIQGIKYMTEKRLQIDVNLIEKNEIRYGSYPGLEAKFDFKSSGLQYIMMWRTYTIGFKEYWQQVVYPQQYERYVQPLKYLDSFKVEFDNSEETNISSNNLWKDENYESFGKIINSLTKFLKTVPLKDSAEKELRQIPNSKPYIKNGQYQGQSIYIDGKEFMFIFFGYNNEYVSAVNMAIAPVKTEAKPKIYDLLHGSLSKLFVETKKDVFDVGNGYHAFIEENDKSYLIQILKAKESAVNSTTMD